MKDNLRKELLQEGASHNEAESLARLGAQLHRARPRGLSAKAKQRIFNELPLETPKKARQSIFRWALAGSLAGAVTLVALLVLPGVLKPDTAPADDGVRTLVQPVESELKELEMEVVELQQQDTIDEAQLQEAEEKYQRAFEHYKRKYERDERFKGYDWDKWRRDFKKRDNRDPRDTDAQKNNAGPNFDRDRR